MGSSAPYGLMPRNIWCSECGLYVPGSFQSVAVSKCGNVQHSDSHAVPGVFSHFRQMPTALPSGKMVTARFVSIETYPDSEERPSAQIEVAGCRPERTLIGVGVPHQCSRADSRLLRGDFDRPHIPEA